MDLRDAHLGLQVENLDRACTLLTELFGLTFADPISGWPIHVRLDGGDEVEHSQGRFTVSRQGPPYLEEAESARLAEAGCPAQAGGLDEHGRYRYTYHEVDGLRVELASAGARAAFERWAATGVADGASAAFERGRGDASSEQQEVHA